MNDPTAASGQSTADTNPSPSSEESARLPRWVRAADAAACALVFLALFVAVEGGTIIRLAGIRVSLTSEWRVLFWAVVIVAVRHARVRRDPLTRRIVRWLRTSAREPGMLPPDAPPPRDAEASRGRRVAAGVGVIALYVAFTAVMTWPQARLIGETVVPEFGDPLLSTWRLSWVAHQLPRDPLGLFHANIFHPERNTFAYSDAMIVPALMVAPLVWAGVHQVVAYNILFLSGFALSGAAMFLLVRSLTRHTGAALLAGFVFAFLPYRYMHYSHLELQMAQWMPLALWAFHRTIEHGRLRDGLLTGLFLALQTLSSWYYGIFFATYLAIVAGIVLVAAGRARLRQALRPLAAGALLAALITAPFTAPYFAARRAVGERRHVEITTYSATPGNYLAAPFWNRMFGETHRLGEAERELFQGFTAPLVAVVGFWPPLSGARIAYVIGMAFAFEASLGYNGFAYTWLHELVFPYRGLRVPARMSIIVGLSIAILAGFGAARIAAILRRRWIASAVLGMIGVGIFMEYRTTVRLREVWPLPPPVYEALRSDPPSVLLELPLVEPDTVLEPMYMYHSTFHWQKLINGYSGFSPPSHAEALEMMATFPDEATMAELRARGLNYIVVHGAFYRQLEDFEQVVARLDRRPDVELVGVARWRERETRVYRVMTSW
ncbi:MAG TPA: hypothetical protein VD833_21145 [Vicinamibacterales bacterium]|nr:hypothetical protein [Vicinamibacterales bacterium]